MHTNLVTFARPAREIQIIVKKTFLKQNTYPEVFSVLVILIFFFFQLHLCLSILDL